MKAPERRGFAALHVVVAATGFAYLYMKYFMTTDDPFALVNHPLQGPTLAAHIVAAPILVVFFGMILRSHTLPKIRSGLPTNRISGWVSVVSFAVMTLSGYLIQVTATPALSTTWFWIHIVSGCSFVAGYGLHFAIGWPIGRRLRRRRRARAGADRAMSRAVSCLLILAGGAGCTARPPDQAPVRVERSVVLMGTVARFVAEAAARPEALEQLERMVGVVEEVEAEISTWRGDSHYGRINRRPVGMALTIPSRPCGILRRAEYWWQETDGAFDPGVGGLVEVWGLRAGGRRPERMEIEAAMGRIGFGRIRLDREECAVTRLSPVTLDAGAFGKGAALDAVRRAMRDRPGRWLVDFGGQVAASEGEWPVALAHPERRDEPALELLLTGGSLATSGGAERDLATPQGHRIGQVRIGHILDPRTGRPVPWRASVSVWHSSALDADALSTALRVMGPEAGYVWAAERALAACFLVPTDAGDLGVRMTPQFERLLRGHRRRNPTANEASRGLSAPR